jgi:hypothetical protein
MTKICDLFLGYVVVVVEVVPLVEDVKKWGGGGPKSGILELALVVVAFNAHRLSILMRFSSTGRRGPRQ